MNDNRTIQEICAAGLAAASTPEQVERSRLAELDRQAFALHQRQLDYERRLESLSRLHVSYVRQHCGLDLMPRGRVPVIWEKLIREWDWQSSVTLSGPTETQKTTAATWAAMWFACDREAVAHTTALEVATASPGELSTLRSASLLILDEVHRLHKQPEWKVGPVWNLVNNRYEDMTTTFLIATIDPKALGKLVGAEVLRRLPLKLTTERPRK